MKLFESHDYARSRDLLIEWTKTLRELRRNYFENTKMLSDKNKFVSNIKKEKYFSNNINEICNPSNLINKMERFARVISQQIEQCDSTNLKSEKMSLDYIEIDIRLAEFELALNEYRTEIYNDDF